MTRIALLLALAATTAQVPASAHAEGTAVRTGDHAGYGRVVFDMPEGATFTTATDGNRMVVSFNNAGQVAQPMSLPRNVALIESGSDTATLVLEPGARPTPTRIGNRLVVDIAPQPHRRDASLRDASLRDDALPSGAAMLIPISTRRVPVRPLTAPRPSSFSPPPDIRKDEQADVQAAASKPPAPATAAPPVTPPVSMPAAAFTAPPALPAAPPLPGPAIPLIIRAAADVGAAAFERDGMALVVLDRRLPEQPLPEGGTWERGATSTLVRLPLPTGTALRLARVPTGWSVEHIDTAQEATVEPVPAEDGTRLPVPHASRVVTILDPETGGILLVGTSLDAGPTAALGTPRRTPGLTLLPTWLGVVVAPSADSVDLRATTAGFALSGGALQSVPRAITQTRRFELPNDPVDMLQNRLHAQQAGAAAAEPRARSRERTAAARSMIALGLGAEAQALLHLVAADDPQAAADAEVVGLDAIAAVLARRLQEATALDDPRLDGTDEIGLWRALRDTRLGNGDPSRLGRYIPLLLAYPASLRRAIGADVVEAAADANLPIPPDALTPYARARQLDRAGQVDEALAAYDALNRGDDRWDQVRAEARATELRLAAGRIAPHDAAAALEQAAFNWRGDGREADLRLRAVDLRAAAGEWRTALDALHAVATAFPDQAAAVRAHKGTVLQSMLAADGGQMSALDTVLLVADFGDAVPEGAAGGTLARLLAEKLAALDLPARAIPVLQGLMQAAPAGEPRAEFGVRLAQLLLDGGAVAAARDTMAASLAPGLPPRLAESRALLDARIRAASGDLTGAVEDLARFDSAGADDLRATLLAKSSDWHGTLEALADLATRQVPPSGPLDDTAQDILMRQASAAAQAGDTGTLRILAPSIERLTPRRRELFRVLTQAPVSAPGDLQRARQDLLAARVVAQRMQGPAVR